MAYAARAIIVATATTTATKLTLRAVTMCQDCYKLLNYMLQALQLYVEGTILISAGRNFRHTEFQ